MRGDLSGRDRIHVKHCRDDQCFIEYDDPGKDCLNLDFLLDRVEREAGNREGLTGDARRERFIIHVTFGSIHLVCQECDSSVIQGLADPFLPVLTEAARDHTCDPEQVKELKRTR